MPYKPMRIAQLLDKTTVVIGGAGVADLSEDEVVQIVAVGAEIPGVGAPLVIPKAVLSVTSVAGFYVIARTLTYETETESGWSALTGASTTRRVVKRHQLMVDDKQVVGNPASSPVAVGDWVMKPNQMAEFVAYLRETGPAH